MNLSEKGSKYDSIEIQGTKPVEHRENYITKYINQDQST